MKAFPGENGFVELQYVGTDAKTEFGPVTGVRYVFWECSTLPVDKRDAEVMLTWEVNGNKVFEEAKVAERGPGSPGVFSLS